LNEAGRLLGAAFRDAEDTFDECGLGRDPTETAAWSYSFGEGVETDDAALVIH
jgi:hypothetical protein